MKLEYNLINGKTNTEPEFQKNAASISFEDFTILQSITPETQEIMNSVDPEDIETVISAFMNPKIMNGMPIKGFPYLLFNSPTEPYTLQLCIGKEALNYEFRFFVDQSNGLVQIYTDTIDVHIVEKDGSITDRTIIAIKNTSGVSEDSYIDNDLETNGLTYYNGEV